MPDPSNTGSSSSRDVLLVSCSSCGFSFSSAMRMDEETFAKIEIDENLERCRVCGHTARYQKRDYFFAPR